MDILCFTGTQATADSPRAVHAGTKALISSTSSETLEANFLRIDDISPFDAGVPSYPVLADALVTEATIFAPSSISGGTPLRRTVFDPEQHYNYEQAGTDTTFFKTRMVGWYPRTCALPRNEDGQASTVNFNQFSGSYYHDGTSTGITFKGVLDGQTDIMVSNMREGMHSSSAFHDGESGAVPPYGPSNYFRFKHYLTAVRLYLVCDTLDLSLLSWGKLNNVIFPGQPSTVTVRLPETPGETFGETVENSWTDYKDMEIVTSPISDGAESVSYPISIADEINDKIHDKIYLGYMLVRPDAPAVFELHTDAGVYQLEVPVEHEGKRLLEEGKIYNINIDVSTEGELGIFIENDDERKFKNLSPWNITDGRFETANCYLIDTREDMDSGGNPLYDGYFFNAMQAGNGEEGRLTITNRDLYPSDGVRLEPVSASILFQTQLNTVRNVELIDGHVRFVLNELCYDTDDPLQANAVIAVHDSEGNILWSWLIWVTQEAKDIQFNGFSMLNMNLGANTAKPASDGNPLPTYGLYYQWGRKDPSPRPPSYDFDMRSMETIPFFGPNGEPVNYVSEFSSDENTIEDSARNPLLIMDQNIQGPNYAYDWLYYEIDQLWGGKSVKTIYDPCPYGYKVPYDELETLFNAVSYNYVSYYYYEGRVIGLGIRAGVLGSSDEIFFPFTGWKGYEAGVPDKGHPWMNVGSDGDYQDSRIMSSGHRSSNRVASNGFSTSQSNRTASAPVRCVRYQNESL